MVIIETYSNQFVKILLQEHKDDAQMSEVGSQTSESAVNCQQTRDGRCGFETEIKVQTTESGFELRASVFEISESGFAFLSDEQATTLLLSMDADTILECGR